MRAGRPRSLKLRKSVKRRRTGLARRGIRSPKQVAATAARSRRRRRK